MIVEPEVGGACDILDCWMRVWQPALQVGSHRQVFRGDFLVAFDLGARFGRNFLDYLPQVIVGMEEVKRGLGQRVILWVDPASLVQRSSSVLPQRSTHHASKIL